MDAKLQLLEKGLDAIEQYKEKELSFEDLIKSAEAIFEEFQKPQPDEWDWINGEWDWLYKYYSGQLGNASHIKSTPDLPYCEPPPHIDQSIYTFIGTRIFRNGVLYADILSVNGNDFHVKMISENKYIDGQERNITILNK